MSNQKVTIVIVNYNSGTTILDAIVSVQASLGVSLDLVVVDNASTDGSVDAITAQFPSVTILHNQENLGFAAAANQGAQYALSQGANWVWFLNPDATVAPDALSVLLAIATAHDLHVLSPVIRMPRTDELWFAGGMIEWWRMLAVHVMPQDLSEPFYTTEYLTGCALLCSRSFFDRVGFFDERFFLYYEDADLSIRAGSQGIVLAVVPAAQVWHTEESTAMPETKVYWLVRSGLLFFALHTKGLMRLWHYLFLLLRRAKNTLDCLLFPKNPLPRRVRQAYYDYFHDNKKRLEN